MSRKPFLLYALVFLSGFSSMSVELAAVRALAPHFGASVFVWTNVLGIVLASLSLGYFVAGRFADRWQSERSLGLVLLWGGGLASCAPYIAQILATALIPENLRLEDSFTIFWGGSLGVGLLAFGPAAFLLSFTSPAAIRFLSLSRPVGEVSGFVFALSTVGSIVGTFLTTYVMVPSVGTRMSFAIAGLAVFVPASILFLSGANSQKGKVLWASIPWLLGIGFAVSFAGTAYRSRGLGKLVTEKETPYQLVQLREDGKNRWIQVNEGLDSYQSFWVEGESWTGAYYDYFALGPVLAELPEGAPLRVCILGLGGGSASRLLALHESGRHSLEIDGVEIDEDLIQVAQKAFALDRVQQPALRIVSGIDARIFLEHNAKQYDLIVLDSYASQIHIPFHLASREFFESIKARLRPGGVLTINVGLFRDPAGGGENDPVLHAIAGTAAFVFDEAVGVSVRKTRNVVLFCRKEAAILPFQKYLEKDPRAASIPAMRHAAFPGTAKRWTRQELLAQSPPFYPLTDDRSSLEEMQILSLAGFDVATGLR